MNLFVFSALFYGLSFAYGAIWGQPSSSARQKQIDLIAMLLLEAIGALLLSVQLKAVLSDALDFSLIVWAAFGSGWLIDFLVLLLFRNLRCPQGLIEGLNKAAAPFFRWILPEEKPDPDSELEMILETGTDPEIVERREVIENALDLGQTTLDEICTHRSDMVSLSMKDEPSRWKQVILANRHTFYPIANESGDDIVGVLDTRDYFRLDGFGKKTILERCVDKPLFAAENTTADELLHMMKRRRTYIAIVLDEYGGVVGLVTLHDIIEELFGELSEEEEKRQADIVRLPRGVWRISGEADLKDVSKALGVSLHLDDFETFSGYVLGSIGYIPEDGSQLEVSAGPLNVQIKRIAGHRIRQALVRLNPDVQPDSDTMQESPGKETIEKKP